MSPTHHRQSISLNKPSIGFEATESKGGDCVETIKRIATDRELPLGKEESDLKASFRFTQTETGKRIRRLFAVPPEPAKGNGRWAYAIMARG